MRHRLALLVAATGLAALSVVLAGASPAAAQTSEQIRGYDVDLTIEKSGALLVHETIDYDFGVVAKHGIFRDIPKKLNDTKDHTDRVYKIDVVTVRGSEGTPDQYEIEEFREGGVGYLRIKVGDPDQTITGQHTYDITYRVRGALNAFRDHDELNWNAIGTQWSVTIAGATVVAEAPATIQKVACFQGSNGSSLACDSATKDGARAVFRQGELSPFQGLRVVIAIPKDAAAAANGGVSPATVAGAKIPKACFNYLKSVSEASSAVADGLVNLNGAVTQAENAASSAIAGDRGAAQAALDATDAVNQTNTQMVNDAKPLMANVDSNIPPCKEAIKKTKLSSSCKQSVASSPKYLNTLIDGHGTLADYISKTVDFTKATLTGDTATANQARQEADRLRAKSNKLATQASTQKKKLDRLYTACLK